MKQIFFTLLLILPSFFFGQELDSLSQTLNNALAELTYDIKKGKVKALYDIAGFLDNERPFIQKTRNGTNTITLRKSCIRILYKYSSFKGLDITDSLTSSEYQKFIAKNEGKIVFSDFLRQFTNWPLEERTSEYVLRKTVKKEKTIKTLEQCKNDIAKNILNDDYSSIVEEIVNIGELRTVASKEYLLECSKGKHWDKGKNDRESQIYSAICYALRNYQDLESVNIILEIMKNHKVYSVDECVLALSEITNIDAVFFNNGYKNIVPTYTHLIDSLKTLEKLREYGYTITFPYSKSYFENPVDYYGKMILDAGDHWWVKYNAIKDLLKLNNPKSLHYLTSQLYQGIYIYNGQNKTEINISDTISKITGISIDVKNGKGNWTNTYNDDASRLNYMIYWYNHYLDYKWDPTIQRFINIKETIQEADSIGVLFDLLFSKEDSTAMGAYITLTQAGAERVIPKISQYDLDGFSNHINYTLPMFTSNFLIQQVKLTDFCKLNKIHFSPSLALNNKIEKLRNTKIGFVERYTMEDTLIAQLTLDDITPLEYYGTLYGSKNHNFTYSVARILDKWYSLNWQKITEDPTQLRLYLKKTALFDELGIIGIVTQYPLKFANSNSQTLQNINSLLSKEEDRDIRNAALSVLNLISDSTKITPEKNNADKISKISLQYYLDSLKSIDIQLARAVVLDTSGKDYTILFNSIRNEKNKFQLKKLVELVRSNLNLNMTPFLIKSLNIHYKIEEGRINRHDVAMNEHTISYDIFTDDKFVTYLENLYGHTFPLPKNPQVKLHFVSSNYSSSAYYRDKYKTADKWVEVWNRDSINYRTWDQYFYKETLKELTTDDTLHLKDFNTILISKYFSTADKSLVLGQLNKLYPCEDVTELKYPKKLLNLSDLSYFTKCSLTPDQIKDVVKLFHAFSAQEIVPYIKEGSKSYSNDEKGRMYYQLIWNTNFRDWIKEKKIGKEDLEEIQNYLKAYLSTIKNLDDDNFERTYINKFIELIEVNDLSIEEKLKKLSKPKNKGSLEELKEVLTDVNYKELATVLKYLDKLPLSDYQKEKFLTEDFGFFLPDFSSKTIDEFSVNYNKMSEYQLYDYYLSKLGIIYKKENDNLDYHKVYDLLKFDVAYGFVGGSGGRREEHVQSLIRLLEIEFNSILGKHVKFSRSLQNSSFSLEYRALLWMEFLKEKKLVASPKYEVPSLFFKEREYYTETYEKDE